MHKIVAIIFSISSEDLTIIAWDDKGEQIELSFPLQYLLAFLDEAAEHAEKN